MREAIDPGIGERVLLTRRRRGLTHEELAQRADIHVSVLSRLEGGKQRVSAERLRNLAVTLGVSADYLLGLVPEAQPPTAPQPAPQPGKKTLSPEMQALREQVRARQAARQG